MKYRQIGKWWNKRTTFQSKSNLSKEQEIYGSEHCNDNRHNHCLYHTSCDFLHQQKGYEEGYDTKHIESEVFHYICSFLLIQNLYTYLKIWRN